MAEIEKFEEFSPERGFQGGKTEGTDAKPVLARRKQKQTGRQ